MASKQLYFIMLGGVMALLLCLVGGTYAADKLLQGQAQQLVQNRQEIAVLADEQSQLQKAKQDLAKYQTISDIAKSVVPQDKDQAQTVRQIVQIANDNGITLSSITFPASTLGAAAGSAPTSGKQLSQVTPVKDIPGVYDLQITLQSDPKSSVPYNQFISFLTALEHNRRTALVSSINIQPNAKQRNTLSFTLILDEYIKP